MAACVFGVSHFESGLMDKKQARKLKKTKTIRPDSAWQIRREEKGKAPKK